MTVASGEECFVTGEDEDRVDEIGAAIASPAIEAAIEPTTASPIEAVEHPAPRMTTGAWMALGAVYFLWGSTYLAIRYAIDSLPPLSSAAIRFTIAGLILMTFLAIRRGPTALRVTKRELASAALIGVLLLAGGNGGVVLSEQYIPIGLSALLVASVPLWIVLWRAVAKDRPNARTLVGVLIGFAGLAVLIRPSGGAHNYVLGVVLVLVASISWSFGSVASKAWLTPPKDPFVASAYQMVFGGLGCALAAAGHGERVDVSAISGRSVLATLYLITFGSLVAFCSYIWLLHTAPISLVATYAYVNPVVAVFLGAIFLGEPVTAAVVIGGLIVVAGVAVVISTERR